MNRILTAALMGMLCTMAACGGGGGGSSPPPSGGTPAPPPAPPPPPRPPVVVSGDGPFIVVDQFGYLPSQRKIAVLRDPVTGFDSTTRSVTCPPSVGSFTAATTNRITRAPTARSRTSRTCSKLPFSFCPWEMVSLSVCALGEPF